MGTSNPATLRMLDATRALTEQTRVLGERADREAAGMAESLGNALERAALANGRVGRMEREKPNVPGGEMKTGPKATER